MVEKLNTSTTGDACQLGNEPGPTNYDVIMSLAARFTQGEQLTEGELNQLAQAYSASELCAMAYADKHQGLGPNTTSSGGISEVHPKGIQDTVG